MGTYLGQLYNFAADYIDSSCGRCCIDKPASKSLRGQEQRPYPLGPNWKYDQLPATSDAFARQPIPEFGIDAQIGAAFSLAENIKGAQGVFGLNYVGGRQNLAVLNGTLDLRWHLPEQFDTNTVSKSGQFNPGGLGASFGHLFWTYVLAGNKLYYSGAEGVSRGNYSSPPRDPDKYFNAILNSSRFHIQNNTYYYYNRDDFGLPVYGAKLVRRTGSSLYYSYDGKGRLLTIYGDVNRLTPYFSYSNTTPTYYINAMYLQDSQGVDSRTTYYNYNAASIMQSIVEPENVVTYFSGTSTTNFWQLNKIVDPDGNPTYMAYDISFLNLLRMQRTQRVTYYYDSLAPYLANSDSPSTTIGSPRQIARSANIDVHGLVTMFRGLGGSITYYDYDANWLLAGSTDPNGNRTAYGLNSKSLRTLLRSPDGGTTYYSYASNALDIIAQLGPRGQATYYGYATNDTGLCTQILDPLQNAVYFAYDSRNRRQKTLDARGGSTYYYYDQYNDNTISIDALNNVTYFAYNANKRAVRIQDPLLHVTYFNYDKMDQMLSSQLPTGELTTQLFTKRGQVSQIGRPGGRATYYVYDPFLNVTAVARLLPAGFSTTYYKYDDQDNNAVFIDPNGNTLLTGFDVNHQRIRTQNALGLVAYYVYDPGGNLAQSFDERGNSTRYNYDVMNRPASTFRGVTLIPPPLQSSILARWKLDETSGSRADDSGHAYFLFDAINNVNSTAGVVGNAANFVANNSAFLYVPTHTGLTLSSDITIALWAKIIGVQSLNTLFSKWSAKNPTVWLYIDSTNTLNFYFCADGTSNTIFTTFPLLFDITKWHHYAVSYSSATGTAQIYIDGVQAQSKVYAPFAGKSLYDQDTTYFCLGAAYNGFHGLQFFNGVMDECYIFNKVIDQKSLSQLVQQRLQFSFSADTSNVISSYYAYDLDGNRTTVVDERSNTSYFGFDVINRLNQTLDANSGSTYFGYDPNNNLVQQLNQRGYATYFGFDALSQRTRLLDAVNRSTYFQFDAAGNRTAAQYADLKTAYFGYDASNRLVSSIDRGGFTTYFGFDVAGNLNRRQDPRLNSTYFQWDLLDRPYVIVDPLGEPTYFGYDPASNLLSRTDHIRGTSCATTYYGYDAINRPIQSLDPLNRVTYYGYDAVGNRTVLVRPGSPQQISYFGYDKFNRRVQSLSPVFSATYFGYDPATNLVQKLNPRQYATYFGYDVLNRVNQTLDALNSSAYFVYDANSNLIRQRDVRGFWTYFAYDPVDRLTQITDAANGITQRGFDTIGNLFALKPPAGNAAYFYYEVRQLLSTAVDGVGDTTYFYYDPSGNRAVTVSARGFASYFGYDALNRLSMMVDAGKGTAYFSFDIGGNVSQVLDALSRSTYFKYDLLDRVVLVNDAQNNTSYFAYDLAGNRNTEMDARLNSTYYGYDVGNRLAAVLDPRGNAAYYGYDANSNLAKILDNDRTQTYFGYDALDRRTSILYIAGTGVQSSPVPQYFGYDAGGNLVASVDAWGAAYFGYDALSRIVQRVTPRRDSVYYAYDAASNLITLQYPQDNKACYYGYDGAQRMIQALSPAGFAAYWNYDADSDVPQKTFGNGMVSYAVFDPVDRMSSLRYSTSAGAAIAYFDYGRDVSGRINVINREPSLGIAVYYSYDTINRLLAEVWRKQSDNSQVYAFSYSYDQTNNRLQMRRESTAGTEAESAYYSYAADNSMTQKLVQIPASGATASYFTYDNAGNRILTVEGGAATYFQYGANQLISCISPPTEAATYFYYDALDQRYAISKAGTLTYYLWNGYKLLEERNGDGSLKVRYTHGYSPLPGIGTTLEVQRNASGTTYYQYLAADHRGTIYAATDSSQNIQLTYTLDAFGRMLAGIGGMNPAVPNDLIVQTNAFTLQIGGVWYLLFRYRIVRLDESTFLSRDFLRYLNKYRLWSNNPVREVDKNGLKNVDRPQFSTFAESEEYTDLLDEAAKAIVEQGIPANKANLVTKGLGEYFEKLYAKGCPAEFINQAKRYAIQNLNARLKTAQELERVAKRFGKKGALLIGALLVIADQLNASAESLKKGSKCRAVLVKLKQLNAALQQKDFATAKAIAKEIGTGQFGTVDPNNPGGDLITQCICELGDNGVLDTAAGATWNKLAQTMEQVAQLLNADTDQPEQNSETDPPEQEKSLEELLGKEGYAKFMADLEKQLEKFDQDQARWRITPDQLDSIIESGWGPEGRDNPFAPVRRQQQSCPSPEEVDQMKQDAQKNNCPCKAVKPPSPPAGR